MTIHYGKLTEAKVAKAKDGMHGDGGGLWLQVTNNGAGKSWLFRWKDRRTGKDRNMGLGSIYKVDLHRARELRIAQWRIIEEGGDPVAVRAGIKLDTAHRAGLAKTVNQVIDEFIDAKIMLEARSKWTKRQAMRMLGLVRQAIGDLPVAKIDTDMLMNKVGLRTMWAAKHTTAQILRGYVDRVFSLAIANKYYVGENPARWEGHLEHMLPASRDIHRTTHRPALPYREVGRFMQTLRVHEDRSNRCTGHPNVALLVEFVVLTGSRVSEVRLATWDYIDRQNMVWTVPAKHHKTGGHTGTSILRPITQPMLAVHS